MHIQVLRSTFRVIFLGMGLFVPGVFLQTTSPFPVWVLPSLVRVRPSDPPGSQTSATLFAARGEYEDLQLVIQGPPGGLSNVNVAASDLSGPSGSVISKSNVTLYRELFVFVAESSPNWKGRNQPLGPGWYPDPLVPFADPDTGADLSGASIDASPFNVQEGSNVPVWVDVLVDRKALPGQYTGTLTVTSDQGIATVPLTLNVWSFEIPEKPSLRSSFSFWTRVPDAAFWELVRHRIMPQKVSHCSPFLLFPCAAQAALEQKLIAAAGLTMTDLNFWSGGSSSNCSMTSPPSVAQFQAAVAAHQSGLFLFNYTADEIQSCNNLFPMVQSWARNMHQAGVANLVVMAPDPALYDDGSGTGRSAVDIWVVLPKLYDQTADRVAQVLQKGDAVWSYNSLIQDSYSPKWEIDFDPLNFRLQSGFLSESLQLTGLLYWRVDNWSADPWHNVSNKGQFSSANYPGEGMLVYPGQQVGIPGVAPSMRLKYLRDGEEDYEYVEILKSLGQGDWAMQTIRGIARNWSDWTRDPEALQSVRLQLGAQIDKLYSPGPEVVSADPSSGSGASPTFTIVVSDAAGYGNIAGVNLLISSSVSGANACWVYYDTAAGTLSLATDDTSTWNQVAAATSSSVNNGQCALSGDGVSAAGSGSNLTLTLTLTFQPTFAGQQNVFIRAEDKQGRVTGYQPVGTWTVPGTQ